MPARPYGATVPAGAHLFALPNKIVLDSARYFTVQDGYRGWSLFGFILLGALVVNLGLALLLRRRPVRFHERDLLPQR
jgi:hypothetical protein